MASSTQRLERIPSLSDWNRPKNAEKNSRRSKLLAIGTACGLVCLTAMVVSGMADDIMSTAGDLRSQARDQRLRALGIQPLTYRRTGGSGDGSMEGEDLTIDSARAILRAPESEQDTLILKPTSLREEYGQGKMIQQLMHDSDRTIHPKLHDPTSEKLQHMATPGQERAERQWSLIFVTAIVTASVAFETLKEVAEENTPSTMLPVVEKFFGELATLGFIGTIAFVLTTDFGDSESILGQLSFKYTGDPHMLIHEFEILHFLIFFVMVFFVSAVLVVLQLAISQRGMWEKFQDELDQLLKDRQTTAEDVFDLMRIPALAKDVEGTVVHEYLKPDSTRQAEFLRFRQRFIDDASCPVKIPEDFDFAHYMTLCISKSLAKVVEVGVYDWVALWVCYLVLYLVNAGANAVLAHDEAMALNVVFACFFTIQSFVTFSAFWIFRTLSYQFVMLAPGMPDTADQAFKVVSPGSPDKIRGHWEEGEERRRDVRLLDPRYVSEMKLIVKDKSWAHDVVDILRGRKDHPSKHEQLFGVLGSDGPALMLTAIKLVLLGSIVSIAVLFTVLFPLLWAINPFMPFFALFPSVVAIILIPRIVTLYTWVTSTEMLKNKDDIINVVRGQKQDKLITILRILSMLSYFLDQVEFLKDLAGQGGDLSTEAISDERWDAVVAQADPKVLEDLRQLFEAFDDDASGELDEKEVKGLIAQLGTQLSDAENQSLFRIMDADGSGAVDFREFATVVLHQKKSKGGKLNFAAMGNKMFAIFDHTGDGVISEKEILQQMERLGKNWDRDSIRFFLHQVDKDGSGEIEKQEFLDYLQRIELEVNM